MPLKRPDARAILFERIRTSPPKFVHLVGVPYAVQLEEAAEPSRVDHVWLTLEVPPFGRLRVAINTLSGLNRDAGFDERVRVAILNSTYEEKPNTGLEEFPGFDYAKVEAREKPLYELYSHDDLAALLIERGKKAIRAEVWGELYAREHIGLHQIHSRRTSSAVTIDLKNRDGALKLYYPEENRAELFLFKFAGQP